uniref:UDENN FLCN/SMCR8-type domain-containing protein n=1 Tax=Ditylenchus dipsaci TaxID=166011 RepID=A0A915DDA6_9BILA
MLEDLVVFGRASADPWNRISCCCKDAVFVLIEFCQIQGPKPLVWFPKNLGPHLDLDQVAIWIMSSENVHGSFSSIYNQQLGLYMLVQHSTMFDITARAFQRPFALAMLTPHAPSATTTLKFQNQCIEVLRPLLSCNRNFFHWIITHCLHIAEDSEANQFDNYYALSSKEKPSLLVLSNRLKAMAKQARPWHTRLLEGPLISGSKCECGSDFSEFNKFVPLIDQYTSAELLPLFELAPCAGHTFLKNMEEAYRLLSTDQPAKGNLFCYNTPLIRSFFGANSQLNEAQRIKKKTSLVHCLFPLLAGERIAILAAKQRECTGLDLIHGLDSLRICKASESSALWTYDGQTSDLSSNLQLYGYSCKRADSVDWKNENFSAVIDLNHHKLLGKEYTGKLLAMLTSLKSFPSDASLQQWIASLVCDLHQLVLLAKYTSVQVVADSLQLSVPDHKTGS